MKVFFGVMFGVLAAIVVVVVLIAVLVAGGAKEAIDDAREERQRPENITLAEFNQITAGLTQDQVETIIGSPGSLSSENEIGGVHTELFTWDGAGSLGSNANVTFQNDVVVSKAQFGLA